MSRAAIAAGIAGAAVAVAYLLRRRFRDEDDYANEVSSSRAMCAMIKPVGGVRPREAGPIEKPRLWIFPSSLNSDKAHIAMHASSLGADFDLEVISAVGSNYQPHFARVNPNMSVPALEIDNVVITESVEIVRYLRDHYPRPDTAPATPEVASFLDLVHAWDEGTWNYGVMQKEKGAPIGFVNQARLHYLHVYKDKVAAADPADPLLASYDAKITAISRFDEATRDDAAIAATQEQLDRVFAAARQLLAAHQGGGGFLVGPYSDADSVFAAVLVRLKGAFRKHFEKYLTADPNLGAYCELLEKTPATYKGSFYYSTAIAMAPLAPRILSDLLPFAVRNLFGLARTGKGARRRQTT